MKSRVQISLPVLTSEIVHEFCQMSPRLNSAKKMIEANERILVLGGSNGAALHTATKRLYEWQIRALRSARRDKKQLEWLIRRKEREKKEAKYIWDTERLMAEIEMLKVVLYLVNRNS